MNAKRIIPCLDVMNGRVVKGVNFVNLRDAGDPVEIAARYEKEGADELTFLDITATVNNTDTVADMVEKVAQSVFLPLTVGGGIRSVEDAKKILRAGADKIGINSAAIASPNLIRDCSQKFGNQCIVIAIDAKRDGDKYMVYKNGGKVNTGIDAVEWAKTAYSYGAGEILLTSIDADGTKNGYDIELTRRISENVGIPIIASGGAGKLEDFLDVLTIGKADAALVASLFHYKILEIKQVKEFLRLNGVDVRL